MNERSIERAATEIHEEIWLQLTGFWDAIVSYSSPAVVKKVYCCRDCVIFERRACRGEVL
jgi:hypothetical protein